MLLHEHESVLVSAGEGGEVMGDFIQEVFPPELPIILLRLILAFCAGAIMGIERERYAKKSQRQKVAGFRTYSLVCFGSCLFGLASIYGFQSGGANEDPGRVAAQVVTGMGFLGAGAIMKFNGRVEGLTTAAGMWVASAIGLLFSAGMYVTAIVASFFAYLALDFHRLFPGLFQYFRSEQYEDDEVEKEEKIFVSKVKRIKRKRRMEEE
nr:MgtC/SapB family protein [Brevibacillus laterosporus]